MQTFLAQTWEEAQKVPGNLFIAGWEFGGYLTYLGLQFRIYLNHLSLADKM